MSKSKPKIDTKQLSILDYLTQISGARNSSPEGRFNVVEQLRGSMRDCIKGCPLSRHQIAGEMSHILGETVTKETIDSWTRESDELNGRARRHIPAEYLPAFCHVTKCHDPLVIMGKMTGMFVLPGPEALRAEIQKLDEDIRDKQAQKKKRLLFLREMGGKNV